MSFSAPPQLQHSGRQFRVDRRAGRRGEGQLRRAPAALDAKWWRLALCGHNHPPTMEVSAQERQEAFEKRWRLGGVLFSKTFPPDQLTDQTANDEARKFWEEKVRAVIDDAGVAELLIPDDHPIGTKRICTDSNYFQTFNRPNVTLISVRRTPPIVSLDRTGITTSAEHVDLDAIVFATGFDALTGGFGQDRYRRAWGGRALGRGLGRRPTQLPGSW